MLTCGAASKILNFFSQFSSNWRTAATFPHLQDVRSTCKMNKEGRVVPVAIIRGGPHCHKCLVKHEFVSFHHQLVSSANKIDIIGPIELCWTSVSLGFGSNFVVPSK